MQNSSSRRTFLSSIGAGAFTAVAHGAAGIQAAAAEKKKPNFLVILADDMGYSDAGCYGGEIATPNLDRLAQNGLRFTQCYSTGRCWPSRACIMTGYYAQQVRMDPPRGRLPAWSRCLPHLLKPLGYRCYHSGKWHVRGAPMPVADGGFDHSYLYRGFNRYFSPRNHFEDGRKLPPVEPGSGYYATCAIADYAVKYLKKHQASDPGKPFFQYLAFNSPHFPLHALQKDIDRYRQKYKDGWDVQRQKRFKRLQSLGVISCDLSKRMPEMKPDWNLSEKALKERIGEGEAGGACAWEKLTGRQKEFQALKMAIHAAMITRMDIEIGRVIDQIKSMGQWENTVVVFASDNGASAEQIIRGDMHDPKAPAGSARSYLCLGPGWSTCANTPFRYHKSWTHEGGISSPFIVHWPKGIAARNELRHDPCHFVDIVPTILDLAGHSLSKAGGTAPPFPGCSLKPAFDGDDRISHKYLYWHHMSNRAVRKGDWKLVAGGCRKEPEPWELYNMKTDRSEMHNLASKHPEKVRGLAALWQELETRFRRQAGTLQKKKQDKQ